MLRNMSIRKRLFVILTLVYIVSIIGAIGGGYYILNKDALREAKDKVNLFATLMNSNMRYVAQNVRPEVLDLLPDTYFPEATVGILMMSTVAEYVKDEYPDYIYKVASPNPLNKRNLSDAFENRVINGFSNGDYEEWEGMIDKGGESFYATAVPIEARKSCIWCHDTPEVAHPDMVEEYGTTSGYGYEIGDIVGGRFVYVPLSTAKEMMMKKLAGFAGGISVLFLLAMFIIDRIVIGTVVKPIENIVEVAEDISRGKMDRNFEVNTNDEIKLLADAFNRMKVSLAKAMDILRK